MASNYCRICGRYLSNPVSVELEIGPIFRAESEEDYRQGVLGFMNAEFDVLKHEGGKYIFIRDIGHGRSITFAKGSFLFVALTFTEANA